MSKKPSIYETAYHEAGHAVVEIALGLQPQSVSIIGNEDSFGRCHAPGPYGYHFSNGREQRSIVRTIIIGCYAGWEAEVKFSPTAQRSLSDQDFNSALNLSMEYGVLPRVLNHICDEWHMRYLRRLQAEAAKLVRRHWPEIEITAKALLEYKELTGEQVKGLIGGA